MDRRTLIGTSLGLTGLAACTMAEPRTDRHPASPDTGGSFPDLTGLTLRVLHPGEVMTMDFNPERLTIVVDEENRIQSARIG